MVLVFISLALFGLILLLVSVFAGDEIEAAPEVEGSGPGFLSVRSVGVFLTAFGAVGAIARWYNLPALLSSLWGLLAGGAMAGIYVVVMQTLRGQEASSLIEKSDLIGLTARVTVAIPTDGLGEVSCTVKAQTTRRLARSKVKQSIAEGAIVRITDVQGDVVLVEPIA